MAASLLIMLREGLEMALIVAILLAYLRQLDKADRAPAVWVGVGGAVVVCVAAGILFKVFVGEFVGTTEAVVEGVLSLTAAAVLTYMIFWMRGHARGIAGTLHRRVDLAVERGGSALAIIAFVAVAREGFESVLILLGATEGNKVSGGAVIVGGLIGLAIAIGIAVLIYGYGRRIDLRKFFTVTGGLLILFAAGLVGKGFHELIVEAGHNEGFKSLWEITSGPLGHGWFNDFLEGMFGWSPQEASVVRVVAYFAYLIPVTWFFFFAKTPRIAPGGASAASRVGEAPRPANAEV